MCCARFGWRVLAVALTLALVSACGGGGGPSAPVQPNDPGAGGLTARPPAPAVANQLTVTVDAGPANSGYNVNRLYASVTLCEPGSTTRCQTIDHVLVDSGSTGLRLLAGVLAPALSLPRVTFSGGFALLNCVQFVDNTYAWGPVATADVVLAGKVAASVPIQLIAESASGSPATDCSAGGTAMDTVASLGAKGILGISLFRDDCGAFCANHAANGSYYACSDAACTATRGVKASLAQQLKNPVPLFATDNNGVLFDLPAASAAGAASLTGALFFGIATQANNQTGPLAVLTTTADGYITTVLAGKDLPTSFLDTGSNGLYFDSAEIAACTDGSDGFYCPASVTNWSATLWGANGANRAVSFAVGNATAMFGVSSNAVLPMLAGPAGDTAMFDWGLPFFYGRRVALGIDAASSPLGTGPYYAF